MAPILSRTGVSGKPGAVHLHRGVFTSVQELRAKIRRYIRVHNAHSATPLVWAKPARVIIAAVDRTRARTTGLRTNRTGH